MNNKSYEEFEWSGHWFSEQSRLKWFWVEMLCFGCLGSRIARSGRFQVESLRTQMKLEMFDVTIERLPGKPISGAL
eukprot:4633501-Amphidinium_carterae.1